MIGLLEIRERIKAFYSKHDAFILPVVKSLFALIVLGMINSRLGYMTKLDNIAIVLIAALMYSFLPTGFIVLLAAIFSILHMYALAMEVALVALSVFLVMFLLFFRFSSKEMLLVVVTPLLCAMKIPYVIPIAAGLLCTPAVAIPVGCGVVVHYLFQTVTVNAQVIKGMEEAEATAKLRLVIDGIAKNKEMLVIIAAYALTVMVVYLIRRMSFEHAWSIAMVTGVMTNIVLLLVGDLVYDTNLSVIGALLGSLLALAAGKVIEFFRFCVDYSRTEKVQFEDDEYYYYVKAVPKMTVAAPAKTVKRINAQQYRTGERGISSERIRSSRTEPGRTAESMRSAEPGRAVDPARIERTVRTADPAQIERTVRTADPARIERTVRTAGTAVPAGQRRDYRGTKSVTIGNTDLGSGNSGDDSDGEIF